MYFSEDDIQVLIFVLYCRGAILACTIPWIKSLLLTHSSEIMSQESSLLALNSMYQVRNYLFYCAAVLASCHGSSVRDTDHKANYW